MALSRSDATAKIESQRRAIREHIDKYKRDRGTNHEGAALKTIQNCQSEIADLKRRCESSLSSSYEDSWRP